MKFKFDYKHLAHVLVTNDTINSDLNELDQIYPVSSNKIHTQEEINFEVYGSDIGRIGVKELNINSSDPNGLIKLVGDVLSFGVHYLTEIEDLDNLDLDNVHVETPLETVFLERFSYNGISPKLYFCVILGFSRSTFIRLDFGAETLLRKVTSISKIDTDTAFKVEKMIRDKLLPKLLNRYNLEKYKDRIHTNPKVLAQNLVDLFYERKNEQFRIPKNIYLFLRFRMLEKIFKREYPEIEGIYIDSRYIGNDFMPEALPKLRVVKPSNHDVFVLQTNLSEYQKIYNYEEELLLMNLDQIVLSEFSNVEVVDEGIDKIVDYNLFTKYSF